MKRTIRRTVVEETEELVTICDRCGMEADPAYAFVDQEQVTDRIERAVARITGYLGDYPVEVSEIPEPEYHTETETSQPSGGQSTWVGGYRMTTTRPMQSSIQTQTTKKVYEGIDADEQDVIEAAGALDETRREIERVLGSVRQVVDGLTTTVERIDGAFVVCDACRDEMFGWRDGDV